MRELVLQFRSLLRLGKLAPQRRWMKRARKAGIHALTRFARTLQQDLRAIEAAVTEPWSNGPVEGHINRLKMLKRQMYGRAGVELLRARCPSRVELGNACTKPEPEPLSVEFCSHSKPTSKGRSFYNACNLS
jgi:hypothetical protein